MAREKAHIIRVNVQTGLKGTFISDEVFVILKFLSL